MYNLLTALIGLAVLTWATFLVWYTLRARWWKHPIGRNIFGTGLVIMLIFLRLFGTRTVEGFKELEVVGLAVYGLAVVMGIQRIYHMETAQHEFKKPIKSLVDLGDDERGSDDLDR